MNNTMTLTHPNAMWRSDAARLRTCVHSCTSVTETAFGMKPATSVASFKAIRVATRRGAPPQ